MQKRQRNVQKSTIYTYKIVVVLLTFSLPSRCRIVKSLVWRENVISRTRGCPRPRTYWSLTTNGPVVISVALWANSMRIVFII